MFYFDSGSVSVQFNFRGIRAQFQVKLTSVLFRLSWLPVSISSDLVYIQYRFGQFLVVQVQYMSSSVQVQIMFGSVQVRLSSGLIQGLVRLNSVQFSSGLVYFRSNSVEFKIQFILYEAQFNSFQIRLMQFRVSSSSFQVMFN